VQDNCPFAPSHNVGAPTSFLRVTNHICSASSSLLRLRRRLGVRPHTEPRLGSCGGASAFDNSRMLNRRRSGLTARAKPGAGGGPGRACNRSTVRPQCRCARRLPCRVFDLRPP
jgi:hypothetical protein